MTSKKDIVEILGLTECPENKEHKFRVLSTSYIKDKWNLHMIRAWIYCYDCNKILIVTKTIDVKEINKDDK